MFANRQQLSSPSPRASFQPQLTRHLLAASLLATSVAAGCDHTDDTPNHRSATGTIDPATGGTSIGEFEPIERADFFCPYRYTPTSDDATASTLPIPYCASATLDGRTRYDFDAVSRLVISQHGRGSDAQMYFDRMNDAAVALGPELPGATFVIAPQFFDTNPIKNNKVEESDLAGILWWKDGGWPSGFSSNGHQGASLSSFTVMDGLVAQAVDQMPNLQEVIFVGQSAGGQTVQKYAVLNNATYPANVSVRYVPANPFAYAYVDAERSTFEFGQVSAEDHSFVVPDGNAVFAWESPLVCPDLVGEARPDDYDDWGSGLEAAPSYSGALSENQQQTVADRYVSRDVTYLIGENDMFTDSNQCGGAAQVQGKHRRRRAEAYAAHVQQLGADHELVKIPDFGHGSGMFEEDCVRRVVFGLGTDCNAMEDEVALTDWSGDVVEVTAFETNDGDDQPELVVAHRGDSGDRLYLLDDVDHGFALLADITPAWGAQARVTGVEVAYLDPTVQGRELVVGVSGGTGGWYVLGRDNGDVLELEAGAQGQDIAALSVGDLSAASGSEIVAAWDTTQGERWRAFAWDNGAHVPTNGGTFASPGRPVAIEVANFVYDSAVEIAVALDSSTGPRLALADLFGNSMMVNPGWADGRRIVDADSSWRLGVDGQPTRELVLATTGGDRPWVILEEDVGSPGMLMQVLESPEVWADGVEPTSIFVGDPFSYKSTVVVGRTGPVEGHAVLYTYKRDEVEDEDVPVLGDVRVEALGLGDEAAITALAFGDLDDRGTHEVLIGRAGDPGFGYRLRVLSAL
ncbi:MAG: hypothetical protein ACRBN8_17590 [Nannocystales bacterium]